MSWLVLGIRVSSGVCLCYLAAFRGGWWMFVMLLLVLAESELTALFMRQQRRSR